MLVPSAFVLDGNLCGIGLCRPYAIPVTQTNSVKVLKEYENTGSNQWSSCFLHPTPDSWGRVVAAFTAALQHRQAVLSEGRWKWRDNWWGDSKARWATSQRQKDRSGAGVLGDRQWAPCPPVGCLGSKLPQQSSTVSYNISSAVDSFSCYIIKFMHFAQPESSGLSHQIYKCGICREVYDFQLCANPATLPPFAVVRYFHFSAKSPSVFNLFLPLAGFLVILPLSISISRPW